MCNMFVDIVNVVNLLSEENNCSLTIINDVLLQENIRAEIKKAVQEKKNQIKVKS